MMDTEQPPQTLAGDNPANSTQSRSRLETIMQEASACTERLAELKSINAVAIDDLEKKLKAYKDEMLELMQVIGVDKVEIADAGKITVSSSDVYAISSAEKFAILVKTAPDFVNALTVKLKASELLDACEKRSLPIDFLLQEEIVKKHAVTRVTFTPKKS